MKVCIPTMGDKGIEEQVGEHFGRVPTYTVYDTETKQITVMPNTSEHAGGVGLPADILAEAGINTMLCAGLGGRAITIFENRGVMVYIGASGTVGETLEMWKNNNLKAATNESACQQHEHRGEGTGEGHGDHHHNH